MTREGGSKLVRDWCCFSNINTVVNASWKQSSTTTRTWTRGARTSPSWIDGLLLEELVQRELALWLVILTLNHLCKAVYIYRTNSEFKFKNWWSISLMYTVKAIAHYAWCTWVRLWLLFTLLKKCKSIRIIQLISKNKLVRSNLQSRKS